ncbi:hypothetical protein [Kibdelosporangium phytohabitans]|uniref:Uncharacterized protein n=1 Tax=Kibdelosporangium phytohabitans TaxID=860235 RepID=A0A0N7F4D5_9PSEU|nr:hypothetical protein [Kibdelosporangium phytohabitans]ALG11127.1 hypothetical protein AOZ06_33380 [Kibdelosporangium phytohabitans]MBE1462375.1 hypothetical protein [Kibdelosporangium phytohabitans]
MTQTITAALAAAKDNDRAALIRLVDWETSVAGRWLRAVAAVDLRDRARIAASGLAEVRDPASEFADRLLGPLAAATSATRADRATAEQALADLAVPEPPDGLTADQRVAAAEYAESVRRITEVHTTDTGVPLAVGPDGRLVISPGWL